MHTRGEPGDEANATLAKYCASTMIVAGAGRPGYEATMIDQELYTTRSPTGVPGTYST